MTKVSKTCHSYILPSDNAQMSIDYDKSIKNANLEQKVNDNPVSFYEFLAMECDLQKSDKSEVFSISKSNDALAKPINKTENIIQVTSLDFEQALHEGNSRLRKRNFQSIIASKPTKINWLKELAYGVAIIVVAFLFTLPMSLFPAHDLVQNPEYWYELIFHGVLSTTLGFIFQCFRASYFLNITYIRTFRNILVTCTVGNMATIFFLISTYHIWTSLCGFSYPIPFLGILATYSFRVLYCIVQWNLFPKDWRSNANFRRQMKYFLMYLIFTILTNIIYTITIVIVSKSSNQNQPFVSLALPLEREIFLFLSEKLIKKSSNGDPDAAIIILKYFISIRHSISLCYVVTIVTDTTSWTMMSVDFAINLLICLRIVWLNKCKPFTKTKQVGLLQELALYEMGEFLVPLSFVLVFVSAYFGPNAELFGNISNSYWNYKSVEDIHHTLENMMKLFLVDFSSTISTSLILWFSCKINLYKVFVALRKEFGSAFCALLGYILLAVSKLSYSNHYFDTTILMILPNAFINKILLYIVSE